MTLQFDMARAEVDLTLAEREWAVEALGNDLAADPENETLKLELRGAVANLKLWQDYIVLLYPEV